MSEPGRYDIIIRQGKTFSKEIWYEDDDGVLLNLSSGYTARMMVRAAYADAVPVLTLTTENSRIALAAGVVDVTPNIVLTVSATVTAALTDWGKGVYDLELVSGGIVLPVLEGYAVLGKEATW